MNTLDYVYKTSLQLLERYKYLKGCNIVCDDGESWEDEEATAEEIESFKRTGKPYLEKSRRGYERNKIGTGFDNDFQTI